MFLRKVWEYADIHAKEFSFSAAIHHLRSWFVKCPRERKLKFIGIIGTLCCVIFLGYHPMFTKCSPNVHMITLSNLFRLSPNVHQMFTKCSANAHQTFTWSHYEIFLGYHQMLTQCSPNVHTIKSFLCYHPMFAMHCCFGPGLVYLYYT